MAMPKKSKIKKILKNIEEREDRGEDVGSKIEIDRNTVPGMFKYHLCRSIIKIKNEKNIKNSELATLMGTDESTASRITNHKVGKIGLEKILEHYHFLLTNLNIPGSLDEVSAAFERLENIDLKKEA